MGLIARSNMIGPLTVFNYGLKFNGVTNDLQLDCEYLVYRMVLDDFNDVF